MDQEQFNKEVNSYMKLVVGECNHNLEKALSTLKERLEKSEEDTMGYAMNYGALQIVQRMADYWIPR